ncbi:MAG: DUF3145 domain-containing protein [Actinomycetia bacterium]|nr:DUF3145 domain-containing protein [Actinomycetes bacterium]
MSTRGVVFVHCCPSAVAPHVEWAIAEVLGRPARLRWTPQPVVPGQLRAEASWVGAVGTGSKLFAALRTWRMLVLEITEECTATSDGERLAYLPGRGVHRSMISANGDVVVGEERLRGLMARARTGSQYEHELSEILGTAWDVELEPYRYAGEGAAETLLHQVG